MMEKQQAGIYLTAPPGGHYLKQQVARIVLSRNKNTPIYYVIVEETFELKTTKRLEHTFYWPCDIKLK